MCIFSSPSPSIITPEPRKMYLSEEEARRNAAYERLTEKSNGFSQHILRKKRSPLQGRKQASNLKQTLGG